MEVAEIIFGESLETVWSQSWVFFLGYRFLNPYSLAYGFLWRTRRPSYDTKKLLMLIVKTVFVKFKISNNFKQNIDETHSKQPKTRRKIHTSL